MDTVWIIFRQIVIMFLYMAAGYGLFRAGKLTMKGSREITNMMVWLVVPVVLINSLCVEFSPEKLRELGMSTLLAAAAQALSILMARLIYHRNPIEEFAVAFPNAGFIGLPLAAAFLGDKGVFYIAGYVVLMNVFMWTYGIRLMTRDAQYTSARKMLLNPFTVSTAVGLILFFTGLGARIPAVVRTAMQGVGALYSPLAMIVLGAFFAQVNIPAMLRSGRLYWLSAGRMLLVPAVTGVVLRLFGFPRDMSMVILIACATPVPVSTALYAQLHDLDYPYACQTVVISTTLSLVCLPLVVFAAGVLGF